MRPKKGGGVVNSKSEAAKERKEIASAVKKEREEKDKEDQFWAEASGPKSKAAKKREEEEARRAETLAKKQEARKLAEEEEKVLETYGKGPGKKEKTPSGKVTAAELALKQEAEQKRLEQQARENERRSRRETKESEYDRLVSVENTNRGEVMVDARSLDEALSQITVASEEPVIDKHPERRLKAAHKVFRERIMEDVMQSRPGLSMRQYDELAWKEWRKSAMSKSSRRH
eukprot:TRINITY_DN905_c0_g1_i2.p1 TRINITY_DN905_c0_g1~~TRINITY_DN905_c0_g1_i2.p1  ORF type:complete len:230 (-),score=75.37 TRINITY_DN905_c0_g1_i2:921-1610(-)